MEHPTATDGQEFRPIVSVSVYIWAREMTSLCRIQVRIPSVLVFQTTIF